MLAKGRRNIQYGSESCLVPAMDDETQDSSNQGAAPELQKEDALDSDLVLTRGSEVCGAT